MHVHKLRTLTPLLLTLEESSNPGVESLLCWKFTSHLDKLEDSHPLASQLHRGLMDGILMALVSLILSRQIWRVHVDSV